MNHVKLVDRYGHELVNRPMQIEDSEELSRIAQLPPSNVTRGLTPRKLATLIDGAHRGDLSSIASLGHEMQIKNGHIYAEMSRRKRSVTLLDWSLTPPNDPTPEEERDTEMLEEILRNSTWLNKAIFNALDAVLMGYSCQNIDWMQDGELIVPRNIHFIPQRAFKVSPENRGKLVINDGSQNGISFRRYEWMIHFSQALSGFISESTLTQVLAFPFIFHSYPTRDLMEFLEIYGIPTRLGRYPSGATKEEKETLLRAVTSIGHNAGGIIPQGMQIEFEQAVQGGSSEFLSVMDWAEKTISKIILGGTLTSQADGLTSTNALGNVHENGRLEIRDSDIATLEPTINRSLILPLWFLNAKSYQRLSRFPTFNFDTSEPEDIQLYATALPQLVKMGMKIGVKWAHERLQIPAADENEPILQAPEDLNHFSEYSGLKNRAALKASNQVTQQETRFDAPQNALEEAINSITDEEYKAMSDPILNPVIVALKSKGLDEAKSVIKDLYSQMSSDEMTDLLTRAIFVSDIWGEIHGVDN